MNRIWMHGNKIQYYFFDFQHRVAAYVDDGQSPWAHVYTDEKKCPCFRFVDLNFIYLILIA